MGIVVIDKNIVVVVDVVGAVGETWIFMVIVDGAFVALSVVNKAMVCGGLWST